MFEFRYRSSGIGCGWRVWRTDWHGDQFEVISPNEFTALVGTCRKFSIPIHPADDDED